MSESLDSVNSTAKLRIRQELYSKWGKPEKTTRLGFDRHRHAAFPSGSDFFSSDPSSSSSSFYVPKNYCSRSEKTWRENFSLLAPEGKNSQTTTKNFSFHFSGKHERQFVRFTPEKIILPFLGKQTLTCTEKTKLALGGFSVRIFIFPIFAAFLMTHGLRLQAAGVMGN
ncbi:hypothetical protein [Porphyromonas gulae]|uniref:hypothetical protein n=1 Tax=Porphyromonas gulae TaxID=111105 RepID=UPI001E41B1FA|nr:hypothetical protein [Porphyromonas gulae]